MPLNCVFFHFIILFPKYFGPCVFSFPDKLYNLVRYQIRSQWDFNYDFTDLLGLRKLASLDYENFSLRVTACYLFAQFL